MFISNKTKEIKQLQDEKEMLMKEIRQVISGEKKEVSLEEIQDKEFEHLINKLISQTRKKNNEYVALVFLEL